MNVAHRMLHGTRNTATYSVKSSNVQCKSEFTPEQNEQCLYAMKNDIRKGKIHTRCSWGKAKF